MGKVINLTESELINLIGRIVEDIDTSFYSDEDFIDAFIQVFRPWVIKNHGDELSNHPPSYLFKKYSIFLNNLKVFPHLLDLYHFLIILENQH